jgi:alpha-tubulin suppressor-like RCC1 family protein
VPDLGGKATSIALASQFGCALLETKKVKCWGTGHIANDGKAYTSAKPLDVSGVSDVEELVANGAVACARSASAVTCWGGEPKISGAPKGTFTQLAAGFSQASAVDAKGAITCWGAGDWGGSGPFVKAPSGVSAIAFLALGDRHACAITKDKKVKCWGSNDAGQLGVKPDIDTHRKPVDVPGVGGAVRLHAGEASTCALLDSGAVKCWGANNEGELGLGKQSSDERPSAVSALGDVASICLGSTHGCAVTKPSKLVCWGKNAHGELGDGSKERKLSPTNVTW